MRKLLASLILVLLLSTLLVAGTFTIDYKDHGPEIVDAYCWAFSYQDTIEGSPNPETQADFTKRMLLKQVRDVVRTYRKSQAVEDAKAAADASTDTDTADLEVN